MPNKTTTAIKEMILGAVAGMGGQARLIEWAKEDPQNERIFWGNIAMKVLPLELSGPNGAPLIQVINDIATKRDADA